MAVQPGTGSEQLKPVEFDGIPEFNIRADERAGYYYGIISHMRMAIDAFRDLDDELERRECAVAFGLLAEVVGR